MKLLGPLLAIMALAVAGFVLYDARVKYETTPASQDTFPPALKSALAQAKSQNKQVVAMFTATWCGPCQRMKHDVIPSAPVQALAGRFIWVYLDVDDPANQAAAREFGVSGIPSFHILNTNGRELEKMVGGRDPETFAGILGKY